jgi:hypothetical protein
MAYSHGRTGRGSELLNSLGILMRSRLVHGLSLTEQTSMADEHHGTKELAVSDPGRRRAAAGAGLRRLLRRAAGVVRARRGVRGDVSARR